VSFSATGSSVAVDRDADQSPGAWTHLERSVTATICMTPASSRRCTRWRTAASERPAGLADRGVRPPAVAWSCSMMALETSSSSGAG
jgi:hypothetical protein